MVLGRRFGAILIVSAGCAFADTIITNGVVDLGLDTDVGYSIAAFGPHGGSSVINRHDEGREVQLSFYSGPDPYQADGQTCHWSGHSWPWNPIGAGDAFGHHGSLLGMSQGANASQLTVSTLPLQWACDNIPCECKFVREITLWENEPVAHVRATLVNNRSDHTDYGPHGQELPAVYTIGSMSKLYTYTGSKPFTNDTISEIPLPPNQPPWNPGATQCTESWAAFVNPATGQALGVVQPSTTTFLLGFSGTPSPTAGPLDGATGYIAPTRDIPLPWNVTFSYDFYLVLGTVQEVRDTAARIQGRSLPE
jgi:hypothetical protein